MYGVYVAVMTEVDRFLQAEQDVQDSEFLSFEDSKLKGQTQFDPKVGQPVPVPRIELSIESADLHVLKEVSEVCDRHALRVEFGPEYQSSDGNGLRVLLIEDPVDRPTHFSA